MRAARIRRSRSTWGWALALLGVMLAAACERDAAANPAQRWPVGAAGRACQFLDYEVVEKALGASFDTAGGASEAGTYTCAMTQAGSSYPDLTLAVTATEADAVVFTATVIPIGATVVKGLGAAAYQIVRPAPAGAGPRVEVGWLSGKGRLMVLRFTLAADVPASISGDTAARLLSLAKRIEVTGPTDQRSS